MVVGLTQRRFPLSAPLLHRLSRSRRGCLRYHRRRQTPRKRYPPRQLELQHLVEGVERMR